MGQIKGHSQDFSLGWAQRPFSEFWESTHSPGEESSPGDSRGGGGGVGTFSFTAKLGLSCCVSTCLLLQGLGKTLK